MASLGLWWSLKSHHYQPMAFTIWPNPFKSRIWNTIMLVSVISREFWLQRNEAVVNRSLFACFCILHREKFKCNLNYSFEFDETFDENGLQLKSKKKIISQEILNLFSTLWGHEHKTRPCPFIQILSIKSG